MGYGDAMASVGPYANNLHLAPDRQHLVTQFLQAECSSWRPTNSVRELKAINEYWILYLLHILIM